MKIWVKTEIWKEAFTLSEALPETLQPNITPPVRIAVAGSGGKTSLIGQLAGEQRQMGKKVLILTTTHMFEPSQYGVLTGRPADITNALERDGIAVAGIKTGEGKITWLGDPVYQEIVSRADVVLVESDGSKGLPVKFPNGREPVILQDADLILVVSGLNGLGKPGEVVCHRWELARSMLLDAEHPDFEYAGEDPLEWPLKPIDLCRILQEGYIKPLRDRYPDIPIIPVINQADDDTLQRMGRGMIDTLSGERGIVMSLM